MSGLPKWAPWAALAWFMLKDKKAAATTTRKPPGKTSAPPRPSPSFTAYLYQLPADANETTRVAFAPPGKVPREMGIFGSPAQALELVQRKGWRLAWGGVRQLAKPPEAATK